MITISYPIWTRSCLGHFDVARQGRSIVTVLIPSYAVLEGRIHGLYLAFPLPPRLHFYLPTHPPDRSIQTVDMPRSIRDSDTEPDSADPEPEVQYSIAFQLSSAKAGHDTKKRVLSVIVEQAQLAILTLGSVDLLNLEVVCGFATTTMRTKPINLQNFGRIHQASDALIELLNTFISYTEECMRCDKACATLAMLCRCTHIDTCQHADCCYSPWRPFEKLIST